MTTEPDDLPEFLKLTSEQRKAGWAKWDEERKNAKRNKTKSPGAGNGSDGDDSKPI